LHVDLLKYMAVFLFSHHFFQKRILFFVIFLGIIIFSLFYSRTLFAAGISVGGRVLFSTPYNCPPGSPSPVVGQKTNVLRASMLTPFQFFVPATFLRPLLSGRYFLGKALLQGPCGAQPMLPFTTSPR